MVPHRWAPPRVKRSFATQRKPLRGMVSGMLFKLFLCITIVDILDIFDISNILDEVFPVQYPVDCHLHSVDCHHHTVFCYRHCRTIVGDDIDRQSSSVHHDHKHGRLHHHHKHAKPHCLALQIWPKDTNLELSVARQNEFHKAESTADSTAKPTESWSITGSGDVFATDYSNVVRNSFLQKKPSRRRKEKNPSPIKHSSSKGVYGKVASAVNKFLGNISSRKERAEKSIDIGKNLSFIERLTEKNVSSVIYGEGGIDKTNPQELVNTIKSTGFKCEERFFQSENFKQVSPELVLAYDLQRYLGKIRDKPVPAVVSSVSARGVFLGMMAAALSEHSYLWGSGHPGSARHIAVTERHGFSYPFIGRYTAGNQNEIVSIEEAKQKLRHFNGGDDKIKFEAKNLHSASTTLFDCDAGESFLSFYFGCGSLNARISGPVNKVFRDLLGRVQVNGSPVEGQLEQNPKLKKHLEDATDAIFKLYESYEKKTQWRSTRGAVAVLFALMGSVNGQESGLARYGVRTAKLKDTVYLSRSFGEPALVRGNLPTEWELSSRLRRNEWADNGVKSLRDHPRLESEDRAQARVRPWSETELETDETDGVISFMPDRNKFAIKAFRLVSENDRKVLNNAYDNVAKAINEFLKKIR